MPSEQRLHPLSFLFTIGSSLKSLVIPILLLLFAASSNRYEQWFAVFVIPYTVVALIRYFGFRYRFDDDELVIKTGFIFRNERHIPYARIQNIGSAQNPFHRLLRVAEVRVETAGGAEPEARIQVLSVAAMEEMRRRVFEEKRKALGVEAPEGVPAAPAEPASRTLLSLPLRELILYGLIDNRGMVVVGALVGLAWEFGWMSGFGGSDAGLWRSATHAARGVLTSIAQAGLALGAVVLFLALLRLFSVGWAIFRLHGFTLKRAGRDLTTVCGLLTRVTATIPLNRIQLLSIRQRPLHRLFARAEVRADTAGGGTPGQEAAASHERLAPLIRKEDLDGLLQEVEPEVNLSAVEWIGVDPRARKRILKVSLLIDAVVAVGCMALAGWWGLLVLLLLIPLAFLDARLQVMHMGYALAAGVVLYRSGWAWRHLSMTRYSKIQAVTLAQSPFDRRYGMAKVRVDTAGAEGSPHQIHIPYLDLGVARGMYEQLGLRASQARFQW